MGKKGLAVIYDPHNLYQFVWYYCNKGREKAWDALCLPNGYKGEYMHTYCEAAGIFDKIYRDNTDFSMLPRGKKVKIFLEMVGSFVLGRRIAYCKKIINQYVNVDDYDEFIVIADVGIVSGACVALGREKEVVILEDGINDYGDRPRFIPRNKLMSAYSWQGFILAAMGYCSPGWFRLKSDEDCIKYCSQPEKMKYRGYRELRQLYETEGTDMELFDCLAKRMYPALLDYNFQDADVVLMTRPLDDFVIDYGKYTEKLRNYISQNYHSVLLKKHPREHTAYQFRDGIDVFEIDNSIPAEALLPYLKGKDIVIVTTSAIMLNLKAFGLSCKNVLFSGMVEESQSCNTRFRPLSKDQTVEYCENFATGSYEIIEL